MDPMDHPADSGHNDKHRPGRAIGEGQDDDVAFVYASDPSTQNQGQGPTNYNASNKSFPGGWDDDYKAKNKK